MRTRNLVFSVFALLLFASFAYGQVTGVVVDDFGPIQGAQVTVDETGVSAETNESGVFNIAASVGETLTVLNPNSLVEKSFEISKLNLGNLNLNDGAIGLTDIIVTGALGIERKEDEVTAAYQVVDSEELNQANNPNAVQALQGKVSGLQINTTNAGINPDNRIQLRGVRSITGNNQALIVIDGAISNSSTLSQLGPESIASINVLKGLQAAALYGSDGVNGAIIVSTVKGSKDGEVDITINSSIDISDIAYLPERQLRYGQGWDGEHFTVENGSWGPEFDGTIVPIGLAQADGSYIMAPYSPIEDNYEGFFKNGVMTQNNLTISGGNLEEGYVLGSFTNMINNFVVKDDRLLRNSFLVKAGKQMGNWLVEANINYVTQDINQTESDLYGELLQTPSNIPVSAFENSGQDGRWNLYYDNPYWLRDNYRQERNQERIAGQIKLGYDVNEHINITYLGNIRNVTGFNEFYNNAHLDVFYNQNHTASYLNSKTVSRVYYGDLMVNFDYDLSDDISFKANIGNNMQDNTYTVSEIGGEDFENPGIYNFENVLRPYSAANLDNYKTHSNKAGLFANLDFGYKDYLYLNLTGRNDWSSVFNEDNNSFFYPSVGVSFIPTEAFPSIYGGKKGLNYFKISGNWTKVGNDTGVGTYEINRLANLGIGYPFNEVNSYVEGYFITNPDIKPEFVTSLEGNVNLGFFNNRLTLDLSGFKTTTTDLITRYTPSQASGAYRIKDNVGDLETTGYEVDLGATPFKSDNFEWNIRASYANTTTEITKLATDTEGESASLRDLGFVGIEAQVGEEFPLIKGSAYERDEWGRIIVDNNGNPTIIDGQILGKATPDYIIGINTSIKAYGFQLSATMDYRGGDDYKFFSDVKRNLAWTGQLVESAENRSGFIMPNSSYDYNGDGVIQQDEGNENVVTGATYPSFLNYYSNYYATTGENLVIDASAFKLREVALTYTFDEDILKNTGVSQITVGVNARNPLTILSKQNRGYADPETSEDTGNAAGLAFTDRYPVQSYYGGTVSIKF